MGSVPRWEAELGLPVHRIRTPKGQIVYAYREEVDLWRVRMAKRDTDSRSTLVEPDARPRIEPSEHSESDQNLID